MKASLSLMLCSLVLAVTVRAQTTTIAATPAAGYSMLTARGASDSLVSIPLVPRSALVARIAAIDSAMVTVTATGVVDGSYAPGGSAVYYLQFVSGNLSGLCYKILNNHANALTLDSRGDDLTHHPLGAVSVGASGDLVRIRPCWTIGTVFGTDPAQILLDPVASLNRSIYSGADAVLLPDNVSAGTEKPPAKVLGFVAGSGWRERRDLSTDASATELWPGVPFVVRRQNPAPVGIPVVGYVSADRLVKTIPALADGADWDLAASLAYPVPATLAGSGLLAATASVITPSSDASHLGDVVLDYPDNRQGFSLPPARRFYAIGAGWFESGTTADQYALQPESGYVLRFRGAHAVRYWVQSPP